MIQQQNFPLSLQSALNKRKEESLFRKLQHPKNLIDFCSNDYLGFSSSSQLHKLIEEKTSIYGNANGATGSRLLSGNTKAVEYLENKIAQSYNAESALLFNSGYVANIGLLSCIGKKDDVFLYDELVHASLHDGMRLSQAKYFKFKHNDSTDLERLLHKQTNNAGNCYVIVESIYSMDGDLAPLVEIIALQEKFNFYLIVDEAHATGVFGKQGKGLCNELQIEKKCFARMHTFGKALGVHGAVVLGSEVLRNYLINFSRSFIYTTALPPNAYAAIDATHELLSSSDEIGKLKKIISFFSEKAKLDKRFKITPSAIQNYTVMGNAEVAEASGFMQLHGFDIRAIKSPTVKAGTERLRICLHSFNTEEQVLQMIHTLSKLK